jgi:hypothetical protein
MFRIRPLRLTSFRAVLEQLAEDAAHCGDSGVVWELKSRLAGRWPVPPVFSIAPDDGDKARTSADGSARSGGAYRIYEREAASESAPVRSMSEEDEVARALRISRSMTPAELSRRRREFARSHHPDRVPEPFRAQATRRMSIANAMIDGALRSRTRG